MAGHAPSVSGCAIDEDGLRNEFKTSNFCMKKTLSIVALLGVIVVCLAIVAKNLFIPVDDGYRSSRERAMIKKFDKDGDGELNRDERRAAEVAAEKASAERKKAYIAKFDKDGDGKLNKEEAKAAQEATKGRKMKSLKAAGSSSSKKSRDGAPVEKRK